MTPQIRSFFRLLLIHCDLSKEILNCNFECNLLYIKRQRSPLVCEMEIFLYFFLMQCLFHSTAEVYHVIRRMWLPLAEQMGLMVLVIFWT